MEAAWSGWPPGAVRRWPNEFSMLCLEIRWNDAGVIPRRPRLACSFSLFWIWVFDSGLKREGDHTRFFNPKPKIDYHLRRYTRPKALKGTDPAGVAPFRPSSAERLLKARAAWVPPMATHAAPLLGARNSPTPAYLTD